MEKTLLIYRTKKDKYMLFQNCHLKAGKFIANKNGYGFVDINEPEDIFIAKPNINKAIHGDTVFVEVIDETMGKKEGKIVKIVDRSAKELVGEYNLIKNIGLVTPDDDHYKFKIEVAFEDSKSAIDGHKVLVRILNRKSDNLYTGEITKVIGHKNDPGIDILSIACKYNINDEFGEETFTIRSKQDKRGYRLGDRVKIKVISSDKTTHKIDFEVLEKLV